MQTHKIFRIRVEHPEQLEELSLSGLTPIPIDGDADWCLLRLLSDHPALGALLDWIEREQLEHHCTTDRSFSRREIRSAKALHIEVTPPETGPKTISPVTIDWSNACERCMRRSHDDGPIQADTSALRDSVFLRGSRGELIVNRTVAMRMIKDGMTGSVLEPILSTQLPDNPDPEFYRLIPTDRLPRVTSPPTLFSMTRDHCANCGRGGLHLNSMLYFDAPMEVFEDLNVTSEIFGDGRALAPEVVVSPRFYNLLVSCGAHSMVPEPVVLV